MFKNASFFIRHDFGLGFFKPDFFKSLFERWAEKFLVLAAWLLLLFCFYSLSNETVFLSFVTELSDGLSPIAYVQSKSGHSFKRTSLDSLWLPTKTDQTIYLGDVIFTESESTLVLSWEDQAKIHIEPNSYVKIQKMDGYPLIRLSQGVVKTEIVKEQIFLIKKGAFIEKVILQKGTYLIKNDQTSGIQITTYSQNFKISQGDNNNLKNVKAVLAEDNKNNPPSVTQDIPQDITQDSAQKDTQDNAQNMTQNNTQHETSKIISEKTNTQKSSSDFDYDLPTPLQGTLFLIKIPKDIVIGSTSWCPDVCQLKVYRNQSLILKNEFRAQQGAVIILSKDNVLEGYYEWVFESETSQFRSDFSVKSYSEENLSKAIEKEIPVEILY